MKLLSGEVLHPLGGERERKRRIKESGKVSGKGSVAKKQKVVAFLLQIKWVILCKIKYFVQNNKSSWFRASVGQIDG